MQRKRLFFLLSVLLLFSFDLCLSQEKAPRVISALPGEAPSDAILLFDGTSLDNWQQRDSSIINWKLIDGTMQVNKGSIASRQKFGDMQIHLEFRMPAPAEGKGQGRGNSGVYIHGNYEVQILDSYENETYFDGQCAAVYQIAPPLVNACRPPGIWQTYDIIFNAAKLDNSGNVTKKASITVLHNGVLVQHNLEISPTGAAKNNKEMEEGPIVLQDHRHPVRFRNIWVREL